jgi:hypothetical protein
MEKYLVSLTGKSNISDYGLLGSFLHLSVRGVPDQHAPDEFLGVQSLQIELETQQKGRIEGGFCESDLVDLQN